MQLQIEYNPTPSLQEPCLICDQQFKMTEARIIVCNEQGKSYGDVCPECLEKGFFWLDKQFQQLTQPKRRVSIRKVQPVQVSASV